LGKMWVSLFWILGIFLRVVFTFPQTIPAIERKAVLGQIYDSTKDSFQDARVFHGELPEDLVDTFPAPSSYSTNACESIRSVEDRVKYLMIDRSTAFSVLSGQIQVRSISIISLTSIEMLTR